MKNTFKRGLHPPARKELTEDLPLQEFDVPDEVCIALSQHIGALAQPTVVVGDAVKVGTMIGKAGGFVSANIYSSVSGKIVGFKLLPNALGAEVNHVVIANDRLYDEQFLEPIVNPDKDAVLKRVQEAGIVGMGGATFPSHVKLSPSKPVDTLIINAAECEPYITCDYRLLLEETADFLKGVDALMVALNVEKAYIGVEMNKPEAIKHLQAYVNEHIEIVPLKVKYPQGAEKQLIFAITGRSVPAGGLPMDVGCVVDNVHTAYSIGRAVFYGEPLYKRAMTVSGKGVNNPGNYWVRGGTPYKFIYNKTQGGEPYNIVEKVISGGPMMGFAQSNLASCTTKGSSSLLFLTKDEISVRKESPCINCCRCAAACPMHLLPMAIDSALRIDDIAQTKERGVLNCIECGCCSYACPAKRPLIQAMRLAKKTIKERGI